MNQAVRSGGLVLLKALSGPQSGAEVVLADGEYTLGSGQDDDLQFVDLCLERAHARIRVEGRHVSIAGGAGSIVNEAGVVIAAGDDEWREIEPLEIIQIGSNSFAMAAADANWAELGEKLVGNKGAEAKRARRGKTRIALGYGSAIIGAGFFAAVSSWLIFGSAGRNETARPVHSPPSLEMAREIFGQFAFGSSIVLRQEADGAIYAIGYVDTIDERRALHDAVDRAELEANLRIWVLSSIRTQILAAIESFGVGVTLELSEKGVATFSGEILSEAKAERFFEYVRGEVNGVSSVVSHVKTAGTYFAEVKDLASRSGVADSILLRLVEDRIEASGVVVNSKVDGWVGFIQSYAKRFADHIALTSYVQVVNDKGEVIAKSNATRLAGPNLPAQEGAVDFDLQRVKQGALGVADVFQSIEGDSTAAAEPAPKGTTDARSAVGTVDQPSEKSVTDQTADRVFQGWSERSYGPQAVDEKPGSRYLPLILGRFPDSDRCWEQSELQVADIPNVLFWLDYLSISKSMSLATFDAELRYLILEAAVNPDRTEQCARKFAGRQGTQLDKASLYLNEVKRSPLFIRYLVRDFVAPPLDVTGVMLRGRERFIQLQDGNKVREGALMSLEVKLESVGMLGALLQKQEDAMPLIYNEKLAWKVAN